jgi:hypothetical protein
VLSAFNWELGCWDELARSTTGTNRLVLAPPQAYIHPQAAWVAARIHAADPAAPAPFVQGSLDIAWKARSRP